MENTVSGSAGGLDAAFALCVRVHARSRRRARVGQMKVTSVCRHCGRPMEKLQGRWQIAAEQEAESKPADQAI